MSLWLIRKTGKKMKAHIWNGNDTACHMASTGGLKMERFGVYADRGEHEVCHMCALAEGHPGEHQVPKERT